MLDGRFARGKMANVYLMSWKDDGKKTGHGIFSKSDVSPAHELTKELLSKDEFACDAHFRRIEIAKNGLVYSDSLPTDDVWKDYPANEFAFPLLSEGFMNLIKANTTSIDAIDFIKFPIQHFDQKRTYYILRFNKLHDVIDRKLTTYVKGTDHIIVPCFTAAAFDSIQIASKPISHDLWRITSGIYVSEKLKRKISQSKIKGIDFSKVRVS